MAEARFTLTPRALADLEANWRYGAQTCSERQADSYFDELAGVFALLAAMPEMAAERMEFYPPARIHSHRRHLVIYMLAPDGILIIRVLGGQHDWRTILAAIEG